jgi:hypothetical protein
MFPAEELVKLGITESVRGELYVLTMPKTTLFQFLFNSNLSKKNKKRSSSLTVKLLVQSL